ncbi:putative sterigmatocystin biosynthesis P450 monooxygenase stcF [Echria macrotheca]|uniref:Sterigmatocystin biosynthesis P450 monooxygenase stcF n=1 Tax=Echria macrotheca TaxID=438768 RepID=A0AAJ0F9W2_9PEZI|nr:putative sterigmatocystin biosynthesis P450 monooxygenase stcF [Echria macrotheca]
MNRIMNLVSSLSGLQIAVLLLLFIPTAWFIYNFTLHPLAGYPGPLLYRGTNLGKISQQMQGNITNKLHELHQTYGPVVRVAPWELSYISAQAWKDIYTAPKGREIIPLNTIYGQNEKEFFGALSIMWQDTMAEHTRHRRILSPAFSDKSLREQEPIIGDLTFGEPFGCLENSFMHPWIRFIFTNLKGMMYGQIIDTMGSFGAALKMLIPKSLKTQVQQHAAFSREKVNCRRDKVTQRPDFMAHIIEHVGQEGGMTSNELTANAQLLIMAGSETSATLLATTCYFLMKNPPIQAKLQQEIRSAFARESDITFASVSKLPYTLAVLHEAMRIHPPVPAGIHRFTPRGGIVIDGRFVAGGADVVVHQYAAYNSPSNFKDPERFVPERWMGDERYAGDNRDVFNPFSIGPRACIGRGLAYMESRLVLARLVWGFDMELMPDSEDWIRQKTWILYEKPPLNAKLSVVRRETTEGQEK